MKTSSQRFNERNEQKKLIKKTQNNIKLYNNIDSIFYLERDKWIWDRNFTNN